MGYTGKPQDSTIAHSRQSDSARALRSRWTDERYPVPYRRWFKRPEYGPAKVVTGHVVVPFIAFASVSNRICKDIVTYGL